MNNESNPTPSFFEECKDCHAPITYIALRRCRECGREICRECRQLRGPRCLCRECAHARTGRHTGRSTRRTAPSTPSGTRPGAQTR